MFAQSLDPVLSSIGVNAVFDEAGTATAGNAAIVRPNVDTLYSKIAIDLSHADVALTIPEVEDDRFYVFPFYDLSVHESGPKAMTRTDAYIAGPTTSPISEV